MRMSQLSTDTKLLLSGILDATRSAFFAGYSAAGGADVDCGPSDLRVTGKDTADSQFVKFADKVLAAKLQALGHVLTVMSAADKLRVLNHFAEHTDLRKGLLGLTDRELREKALDEGRRWDG